MTKEQTKQLYDFVNLIDIKCPHNIIAGAEDIKCEATYDDKDCISCWKKALENELGIEE